MSARRYAHPASQMVPTRVVSAHVPMTTARWDLFHKVAVDRDRYVEALREIVGPSGRHVPECHAAVCCPECIARRALDGDGRAIGEALIDDVRDLGHA